MSRALRDEIVTYLEAQSYSAPFDGGITVTRVNQLLTQLENANTLTVTVSPGLQSRTRESRKYYDRKWVVAIAVQERIDVNTDAQRLTREDELIELSNEISNHMEDFQSSTGLMVEAFEERPPFFPDDLELANQLTVILLVSLTEYGV